MKILSIQNITHNKLNNLNPQKNKVSVIKPECNSFTNFRISFRGFISLKETEEITSSAFKKAKTYLASKKLWSTFFAPSLSSFNLNKLNGIQEGIKVFKDMTMKEITFILEGLKEIMVFRGCRNGCSHCGVDAIAQHFNKDSNMINSMLWEDFSSLMHGIEELNQRLGFNTMKKIRTPGIVSSLFRDADCIDLKMKDMKGKIYDFTDANHLLHQVTNKLGIFDTSGWTLTNKKHQKYAEKIVKHFSKGENMAEMFNINISINPFHSINEKSIKCKMKGDEDGAKKFRDLYTRRIANAIFTFTPIIESDKFNFILRFMSDNEFYDENALKTLKKEILGKLRQMYKEDYKSAKKYIKCKDQIDNNIQTLLKKLANSEEIGSNGRAEKLFNGRESINWSYLKNKQEFLNDIKNRKSRKLIDVNGNVFATNGYLVAPTELRLNFINKTKKTVPPEKMLEGVVLTKEMIDKLY